MYYPSSISGRVQALPNLSNSYVPEDQAHKSNIAQSETE